MHSVKCWRCQSVVLPEQHLAGAFVCVWNWAVRRGAVVIGESEGPRLDTCISLFPTVLNNGRGMYADHTKGISPRPCFCFESCEMFLKDVVLVYKYAHIFLFPLCVWCVFLWVVGGGG